MYEFVVNITILCKYLHGTDSVKFAKQLFVHKKDTPKSEHQRDISVNIHMTLDAKAQNRSNTMTYIQEGIYTDTLDKYVLNNSVQQTVSEQSILLKAYNRFRTI
jgi:hypothetical protein